jgi:hypothetical protein
MELNRLTSFNLTGICAATSTVTHRTEPAAAAASFSTEYAAAIIAYYRRNPPHMHGVIGRHVLLGL